MFGCLGDLLKTSREQLIMMWGTTPPRHCFEPKNRLVTLLLSHRLETDRAINGMLHGGKHREVSRSRRGHQGRPEGVFLSHALEQKAFWAVRECIVELVPNLSNETRTSNKRKRGYAQKETML